MLAGILVRRANVPKGILTGLERWRRSSAASASLRDWAQSAFLGLDARALGAAQFPAVSGHCWTRRDVLDARAGAARAGPHDPRFAPLVEAGPGWTACCV